MLQILELTKKNIIAIRAEDRLTETDIQNIHPLIDNIVNKGHKVRWYFEMKNFTGWKLNAFWKDAKMDLSHADDYEKIAMVGDKKWQAWITQLMEPFTGAEIRYFNLDEKEEAKQWIQI